MYDLTFQQIETFFSIAKHRNLSNAADAMFISQPALSKTLQRLEKNIGLKLFYRNNQGISLTPEGEYLLSTLEPLYSNIEKTISTAHKISEISPKRLNIIESSTFDINENFDTVKEYLRTYEEQNPNVVIMESLGDFKDIRNSLEYCNDDLAITQEFGLIGMEGITYKKVSPYQLYLASACDHKFAAYDSIDSIDKNLLAEEICFGVPMTDEVNNRKITIAHCRGLGFEPKSVEFVDNFLTLLHKIKTKKGIAICGKFTIGSSADEPHYLPLEDFDKTNYVVLAWKTGRLSAEAKKFAEMIQSEEINM